MTRSRQSRSVTPLARSGCAPESVDALHRSTEWTHACDGFGTLQQRRRDEALRRRKCVPKSLLRLRRLHRFSPGLPPAANGSDTNIQESGVGEYDDVKRVGDLVYSIGQAHTAGRELRVHRLDGDTGIAQLLHTYSLPMSIDVVALGLHALIRGGRMQLVLLTGRSPFHDGYDEWCLGYTELDANVMATVFDVANDGALTETDHIEIQGSFSTSRLIGTSLLFASGFVVGVDTELQPLLPKWRLNDGPWQDMASLATTWLPNFAPDAYERSLVTLAQFDLDALDEARFTSVFARVDASYVAPAAWYLATSEYRFDNGFMSGGYSATLDIHKIALPGLDYRGTGTVAGGLAAGGDDRAFRFSEHNGDLRVLTDHGWAWDATSLFELNVLREDADYRLRTIATLPNALRPQPIGPPHEQPYGVRFDGDVAYAVSYFRVDPLYAIDLSDPLDPKLDSALEIAGYSAYLHPLPGGFLLGVGQDAVAGTNGDAPGQSWFQGLKLSLFDQRDRQHPSEAWRQVIGGRGSDTEVLRDHRAFASAATANGMRRIAVPVVVHDGVATAAPWLYLPWRQTGVATFDVSTDGLISDYRLRPAVVAGSGERNIDARSVLLGDSVFLFSSGHWYGQRMDRSSQMSGPY
ncbi:MAG: beta-propeller domain-containing protein [Rhodanobacteraceae bacterium]|nr:beta-propeller domain-containing protein [Rhodanobacteraceae bacterium]